MRATRGILLAGLFASAAACGDDGAASSAEDDTLAPVDTLSETAQDASADAGTPEVDVADTADLPDSDVPDSDVVLTEPGTFVLGTADLDNEYVFKGVWAGEADRIVAVGNDGVVASQGADGQWSVLAQVEGAELINAIHGVSSDDLWAVGKNGTRLSGTVESFGQSLACETNEDCNDFDSCTIDVCSQGKCIAQPAGLPGCCGIDAASWDFDGGTLSPWVLTQSTGGIQWSVVSRAGRSTSGSYALYFGDPKKEPPNYDTGQVVTSTVESPSFTLPPSGTATLSFSIFMDTESDSSFDVTSIDIQSGAGWTEAWHKSSLASVPTFGFVTATADLTPWRGETTKLRIRFDSVDSTFNDLEGVYIDTLIVTTACTAGGTAQTQSGPTLWGVHAVSGDNVYAVGQDGTILRYDGQTWAAAQGANPSAVWNGLTGAADNMALVGSGGAAAVVQGGGLEPVQLPQAVDLHAVDTVDGRTFWAVGDQGTILRGEGTNWVKEDVPTSVSFRDVLAVSNSEVYAVGLLGTLYAFDGSAWSPVTTGTQTNLYAVWVDDAGKVTLAGQDGAIFQGNAADGFTAIGSFHPGGELVDLWGPAGSSELFAVGNSGKIVHYDGAAWSEPASGTSQGLLSVYGVAADDVWAVGRAGTALHWDGAAWTRFEVPIPASINAVWGDASNNFLAAGSGGVLMVWNGTAWLSLASSTDVNLRGVYARNANDVWAVGAGATAMRFNGLGWARTPVDVNEEGEEMSDELHAVWAASADDAWAVGSGGRLLRWDGSMWLRQEVPFPITLRGIYGLAANDIWAVGNEGHIMHFNGETWQRIETGSIATLHGIHGDGAEHVVVVGDIGTVLTLQRQSPTP